ncbi:MAG: hypothetical protein MRY74_04410 [Neomegalonema sp.]|nr:hypothetical protein [Neomegalonema sp.]
MLRGMMLAAALACAGFVASTAAAQSWPAWCSKSGLNPTEQTICETPLLRSLENRMIRVYIRARTYGVAGNPRSFVIYRNRCGREVYCIEQAYRDRIAELRDALRSVRD